MGSSADDSVESVHPVQLFKYLYSTALLLFSATVVIGVIFNEDTRLSLQVHPALALVVMLCSLIWLNMIEGGQGAFVGLPPVDRDLYIDTHPRTAMCTKVCHKGDNLDRYLIGRQFMVLSVVFITNLCGAPLGVVQVFGLTDWAIDLFLRSGVAMILMTTMAGQLNSQVNASHCMLDYVNNYFALFTLYVALAIEYSGLLHTCYLVQMFFSWASGKPPQSKEPPRTAYQQFFFGGRILVSLAILSFSFAVTLTAIFNGQTTMWVIVPNGVAVALFFVFMAILGMLEGMQIAFFAVTKLPKERRGRHPMAKKTCELLFRGEGRNLPGFMIGRQLCVTMCFFIIARITSLDIDVGTGENIFGVSDGVQKFFNTGLLGALITTIVGSITWQLLASAFPIAFLSNPLVYFFLRFCLLLEATGVCSGAWVLASIHKRCAGFQLDSVYIGTAEERAAGLRPDRESRRDLFHMGTNVLQLPAGGRQMPNEWVERLETLVEAPESFSFRRHDILNKLGEAQLGLKEDSSPEKRATCQVAIKMEIAALIAVNEEEEEALAAEEESHEESKKKEARREEEKKEEEEEAVEEEAEQKEEEATSEETAAAEEV